VACPVPRGNERENAVVFGLYGLPLSFCKGDFCHLPSENVLIGKAKHTHVSQGWNV